MKKKIIKGLLGLLIVVVALIGLEMTKSVDKVFPKQDKVFGIKIYATKSVADKKIKHVKTIISEYIDNDEDGHPDNPDVLKALVDEEAGMMITKNSAESMKIFILNVKAIPITSKLQELYDIEIHPNGQKEGKFDASVEEILHLITHVGYAKVYPDVWGEVPGSDIATVMDVARGGRFITVPLKYPESAWYSYYDKTADYGTMVTEYVYWSLTSILGAQDYEGRFEAISGEWKLNTKDKVQLKDPKVYELLTNPIYKLPTVLPDGKYLNN